jgi:hypothetical protein
VTDPAPGRSLRVLVIAGTLLAVLAPHLHLVVAGALIAAVAASAAVPADGTGRKPLLAFLVVPALLVAGHYMTVIAEPTGLATAALPGGPFSPAAEAMLLPPLAIAAIGFFAPWPLARMLPGPVLSLVGVALLLRLGQGALPGALDAWRTVFVPLAVVAAWGAAATQRVHHAAAAMAFAACFAAGVGGVRAAWTIAAALVLAAVADALPARGALRMALGACAAAAGALGAALALAALLRSEVVYGVAAWLAALLLAARLRVEARPD